MMKRTKKIAAPHGRGAKVNTALLVFAGFIVITGFIISCGKLDVVGTDSVRAFGDVLKALPPDSSGGIHFISAPDNSSRFIWTGEGAAISFDITPFVNAGLDVSAFDNISGGIMVIGRDFQSTGPEEAAFAGAKAGSNGGALALDDYAHIVKIGRGAIGYHAELDHYGVNLGDGNLFEWAKNMSVNDKDIVLVLNPEPFIAAGVDPSRIEGWVFTKVTVDDPNGKSVLVDKILKPFNLL